MSLLIGTRNFANQVAAENQILSLGSVYRKFCKRNNCVRTFEFDNSEVILQQSGIYHITVTAVASGAEAGDITLALYENGVPVPGAISTQTITTPDTELRTLTIDYYALVDSTCVLGCNSVVSKAITLVNTGVEATYTNLTMNIEKVLSYEKR